MAGTRPAMTERGSRSRSDWRPTREMAVPVADDGVVARLSESRSVAMAKGSSVYDGPIIGAHTHLWDLSMGCHGWLTQADGVSALGGLKTLRRDVVVETFRHDCANQPIVASVHIEALWIRPTRWGRCVGRGPPGHAARSRDSGAAGCVRACGRHPPDLSFHPTHREKSFAPPGDTALDPAWQRDVARVASVDCCWR